MTKSSREEGVHLGKQHEQGEKDQQTSEFDAAGNGSNDKCDEQMSSEEHEEQQKRSRVQWTRTEEQEEQQQQEQQEAEARPDGERTRQAQHLTQQKQQQAARSRVFSFGAPALTSEWTERHKCSAEERVTIHGTIESLS